MEKMKRLGDLLLEAGLIDEMQLQSALGQQKRWGGKLGKALVDLGFIDEDTMVRFLSKTLGMRAVNLIRSRISPKTFASVPIKTAKQYEVIPVLVREEGGKKTIVLAMSDPSDMNAIDQIQFTTGAKIEPVLATDSAISKVLQYYGDFNPELAKEYAERSLPAQIRHEAEADAAVQRATPTAKTPEKDDYQTLDVAVHSPEEDVVDLTPDDELEVVKGEVFMLKTARTKPKPRPTAGPRAPATPFLQTAKPQAPPPARTAQPPARTAAPRARDDDSIMLGGGANKREAATATPAPSSGPATRPPRPGPASPNDEPFMPYLNEKELSKEPLRLVNAPISFDRPPPAPTKSVEGARATATAPPPEAPELEPLPSAAPPPGFISESPEAGPEPDPNREEKLELANPYEFMQQALEVSERSEGQDQGLPPAEEKLELVSAYDFMDQAAVVNQEAPPPGAGEEWTGEDPEKTRPTAPGLEAPSFEAPGLELPPELEPAAPPPVPVPPANFFSPPVPPAQGGLNDDYLGPPSFDPAVGLEAPPPVDEVPDQLRLEPPPPAFSPPPVDEVPLLELNQVPSIFAAPASDHDPLGLGRETGDLFGETPKPPAAAIETAKPALPEDDLWGPPPASSPGLDLQAPPPFEDLDALAPPPAAPPTVHLPGEDFLPPPIDELGPPPFPPPPPETPATEAAPPPPAFFVPPEESPEDLFSSLDEPPLPPPAGPGAPPAPAELGEDLAFLEPPPSIEGLASIEGPAAAGPAPDLAPPPAPGPTPSPAFTTPAEDDLEAEQRELEELLGRPDQALDEPEPPPPLEAPPSPFVPAHLDLPPPPPETDLDRVLAPPPPPAPGPSPALQPAPPLEPPPAVAPPTRLEPPPEPVERPRATSPASPPSPPPTLEAVPDLGPSLEPPILEPPPSLEPPPGLEPPPFLEPPPVEAAAETTLAGELKQISVPPDESPESPGFEQELLKMMDPGADFLDTREVKQRLERVEQMEGEIKRREHQFDELLNLMMKKELGEITQEIFMKQLQVLKKRAEESKEKKS